MSIIDIMRQEWFAISPSPISFLFYIIIGIIGSRKLLEKQIIYKHFPKLIAFSDAILVLGIIVLIQDTHWLVCNTFRWIIPLYFNIANFSNYYIRFPQNILAITLFFLLTYERFSTKTLTLKKSTLFWTFLIFAFQTIVFVGAPNQAFSDWTFAARNNYADWIILQGFGLSIFCKALMTLAFLSLF